MGSPMQSDVHIPRASAKVSLKAKLDEMKKNGATSRDCNAYAELFYAELKKGVGPDKACEYAELTSKARNGLKDKTFAVPGARKYPINDVAHARNALSRVAANGSPKEKAMVRGKVKSKFPNVGKK